MHYGKPKSASESDIYYSGSNPKTNMKWLPSDETYGLKKVSLDEVASLSIQLQRIIIQIMHLEMEIQFMHVILELGIAQIIIHTLCL